MICNKLTRKQSNKLYEDVLRSKDESAMRTLCLKDLFFLLSIGFKRKDVNRDWLYERCREVERAPNGYLDLWSREFYKSTIITYAKTVQDILNNPNITVGIFSHTRPIAKAFLSQIKLEFEGNNFLKMLFPEILYANPKSEAPRWSLDNGIIVKRSQNPKESTVEAWGLVDGMPISKHYSLLVYDDVVTRESVSNTDQIKKTTEAWELSLNLGAQGGVRRMIGTRYHYGDTYKSIMDRGAVKPRVYSATKEGTWPGTSIFLGQEVLAEKRRDMGPYIFSSQMLQNPSADRSMGFKKEWLRHYDVLKNTYSWNYYIVVDPAGEKKKENDFTVINVIGLAPDKNFYLVDAYRDRVNLTERTNKLFDLVRKWKPIKVVYEKYGKDSDIEHIKYVQEIENYRFEIEPIGGATAKNDRIRRLVPIFEQNRFYMPHKLDFIDHEKKQRDYIAEFITDEYEAFPVAIHDDMLDCMARIVDPSLKLRWPEIIEIKKPSVTMENETNRVETDYDILAY